MKRFLASLLTISFIEVIGRHPAVAASVLTLLGVGGGVGIAMLTTPTLLPAVSSNFNPNQSIGTTNNALKPNSGVAGASSLPSTATNSAAFYFEFAIDPNLAFAQGLQSPFSGMLLNANNVPGQPSFFYQRTYAGQQGTQWWLNPGTSYETGGSASSPSNTGSGLYPFTANTSGCTRPPAGVVLGGTVQWTDPGFGCPASQTVTLASIPSLGIATATGVGTGTTCAVVNSQAVVTAHIAVAHGLTPGLTYTMAGFTPTGYNSAAYTALPGTTGTTLVGTTGATSCPAAVTAEGTALAGSGGSITPPTFPTATPFSGGPTGITVANGQHICGWLVENGDDSDFPGSQSLEMVDDKGNALPGAPALVPTPNQGDASMIGYTLVNTQSPSSPALVVTALNTYTGSGSWAAYNSGTGRVTFSLSTNPSMVAGSQFTVSGMTPSGFNQTYVTTSLSGSGPYVVVGRPISAPNGIPITNNPGASTGSGGMLASNFVPGQTILGATPGQTYILPYGTYGSTGVGGVGTYALSNNQTAALGSSGSPVTIFGYSSFYFTATANGALPAGASVTHVSSAALGDFMSAIGGSASVSGTAKTGWGGAIGNVATLWGALPLQSGDAPSMSDLASICTKQTDIQAYAATKSLTLHSLYRLNDPGIWGDSAAATITGYITNANTSAGTATLNVSSTTFGTLAQTLATAYLSGPGLGGGPGSPPTLALTGTAQSTYTLTFPTSANAANLGSIGSPVTFAVGAFKPALPIQSNTLKGYIDTTAGVSTLHVTSFDDGGTHSGFASFTGSLNTTFQGSTTSGSPTLTVTSPTVLSPSIVGMVLGPGMTVYSGTTLLGTVQSQATSTANGGVMGLSGTYTLTANATATASGTLLGGCATPTVGCLAGPPTNLTVSGVTGSLSTGMAVTDGGASLTGAPLLITGGSGSTWTVAGNYYPPVQNDGTMTASLSTVVPGEYVQTLTTATNPNIITNPVKVTGYQSGAIGLVGNYTLSGPPNAAGTVGSSGSPVVFSGTTITDGGAVAPGPALTIRDQGPAITFPLNTPFTSDVGAITVSGTYDTSALGGAPSSIQAQVSLSADGPPVPGCTACAWTNLASYAATPYTFAASITTGGVMTVTGDTKPMVGNAFTGAGYSGTITANTGVGVYTVSPSPGSAIPSETMTATTVHNWIGQAANIPGGGPYFVSVRAANGTAYATIPNAVKVGLVFALYGQGQADSILKGSQAGNYNSFFPDGLWGANIWASAYGGLQYYLQGPPITANFYPGQAAYYAGDRFGITATSEGTTAFDQGLSGAFGVPASAFSPTRDGVGVGLMTLGNVPQTQTIGAGDGSTSVWCSLATFCPSAGVSPAGQLVFGGASLTGGWFTGTIGVNGSSQPIVTATTRIGGALEPGMVLNTPNAPTLIRCLTGCSSQMSFGSSTWLLSSNADNGATGAMRADAPASLLPFGATTTPWPNLNIQLQGNTSVYGWAGFGEPIIKAGTFSVSVNGTVVCRDTQTFAYNLTGGNCADAGGGVVWSGFVNYETGDYQINFATAPASGAAIIATWTNIVSPETFSGATSGLTRPQNIDFFGDGSNHSGADSTMFAKAPGGVNGHIYSGYGTDHTYQLNGYGATGYIGYQFGALGYSQMVSWLYGTKFPALIPGASPNVPFMTTGQWRVEGPLAFGLSTDLQDGSYDAWAEDIATKSTFSGTIASSVLTLSANAVGPMWEGEIVNCVVVSTSCNVGPLSGVYITSLASGAWGQNGSSYHLAGSPASVSVASAMQNPVYYSGSGTATYLGTLNDIIVQTTGLAGTTGRSPHTSNGFMGGRRATSRWAAMIYGANGGNASDPKVDRVKADAPGCVSGALAAPCFDADSQSTKYDATFSSATWSGNTVTISGGLAAHARPFVVGQAFSCASCASGLVITSLSVPPTESTAIGAGEVGQTFTFTAKNPAGALIGGAGSGAITGGCTAAGGANGSNCIDVAVSINNGGTFGTAAAIATCGANNVNGIAPNYAVANGVCKDNGIGEIVRTFRIGTTQPMYGPGGAGNTAAGSVFDEGADMANGAFNQSAAFTCNIVAAKIVQCVKAPAYASGVFSGVGNWASGSTFVNYGDVDLVSGRLGSLLGYVGGQSFPFTPGSGYTSGTYTIAAVCPTVASGDILPKFDVTVSGGAIANVVPSAASSAVGLGIGAGCTVPLTALGGGTGGAIAAIPLAPLEGLGGIGTYNTDTNTMGTFIYDNSGFPGNPLNSFFTNGQGGYFEPGLPLRPFGIFQGVAVSG